MVFLAQISMTLYHRAEHNEQRNQDLYTTMLLGSGPESLRLSYV